MADHRPPEKEGRGLRGWLVIVGVVLLVLFLVLNFQKVKVNLIVASVTMPLIIALGISAVLGAIVAWALRLRRGGRVSD